MSKTNRFWFLYKSNPKQQTLRDNEKYKKHGRDGNNNEQIRNKDKNKFIWDQKNTKKTDRTELKTQRWENNKKHKRREKQREEKGRKERRRTERRRDDK